MDYSQWQQPPVPEIEPPGMNQSAAVDAYYASYYAYNENPNPNSSSDPQPHESFSAIAIPPPPGVADTTSYYSFDTNAQNLAWQEAVRMYGTDHLAITGPGTTIGQPHSIYPSGFSWTGHIVQTQLPISKKRLKKTKLVQSAYCEVCKVDCNGPSVYEQHILGKKHLKNLDKLKTCLSSGPTIPLIGPQENPCKSKARKKGVEDLESKRRRVIDCGVSNESIRLCRICNVVCNSDTVYNDHLAGQKHAAKAAKVPVNAIVS